MRKLQTSDVFALVRLINKAGIKDEIKAKILEIEDMKNADVESFGYDMLDLLIEKAAEPKIETEIYVFFADIFETSEDEIKTMDPIEFFNKVLEVATLDRWLAFFESAAKLMKSK